MRGSVNTRNVHEYAPEGNPHEAFDYVFVRGKLNGEMYLNIINQTLKPQLQQIFGQHRDGTLRWTWLKIETEEISGVARAFLGGRLAHPEGQNEEENK